MRSKEIASRLKGQFKNIWRCADSNKWHILKDADLLSFDWINKEVNYNEVDLNSLKRGKKAIRPFVSKLKVGDLVFIMGKNSFQGIGICASEYDFEGPLLDMGDTGEKPAVQINYIYKAETSIKHDLETHNFPTTFAKIDQYNFGLLETLSFLEQSVPDAFSALVSLTENSDVMHTEGESLPKYKGPLNQILYGPPGTGKTYKTTEYAMSILEGGIPEDYETEDAESRRLLQRRLNEYTKEGRVEFITFHQSYGYEDFVVGIKPKLDGDAMAFSRHEGVFFKICQRARENYLKASNQKEKIQVPFEEVLDELLSPLEEGGVVEIPNQKEGYSFKISRRNARNLSFEKHSGGTGHTLSIETIKGLYEGSKKSVVGLISYYTPLVDRLWSIAEKVTAETHEEPLQNYVLIIDEINRANISRVLGELITLLEPDKRLGSLQEMEVRLPTGELFSVPPNLYIIGTMNTADKSIALLDIALRRRFAFKELLPEADKVENPAHREFFINLNQFILEKKGKDFLIGHSYFMSNGEELNLVDTMNHKVIPLLAEYFYKKEQDMLSIVKEAINNSGLSEQYSIDKDSAGFNQIVFESTSNSLAYGSFN